MQISMTQTLSPTLVLCLGAISPPPLPASPLAGRAAEAPQAQARKGGEDIAGPYEPVANWPQPLGHAGYTWGSMGGVFAETPDRVFLLQRGELPVPAKPFEGYPMASPATSGQPRLQNCILI